MKLDCIVVQASEEGAELNLILRGWAQSDPDGTSERHIGGLNIPSTERNRVAFHVGRRIKIDVRPT